MYSKLKKWTSLVLALAVLGGGLPAAPTLYASAADTTVITADTPDLTSYAENTPAVAFGEDLSAQPSRLGITDDMAERKRDIPENVHTSMGDIDHNSGSYGVFGSDTSASAGDMPAPIMDMPVPTDNDIRPFSVSDTENQAVYPMATAPGSTNVTNIYQLAAALGHTAANVSGNTLTIVKDLSLSRPINITAGTYIIKADNQTRTIKKNNYTGSMFLLKPTTAASLTLGGGVGTLVLDGNNPYNDGNTRYDYYWSLVYLDNKATAVLKDKLTLQNNYSVFGGAVCALYGSSLTMDGTLIRQCTASSAGGAIHAEDANVSILSGTVEKCSAAWGGGIYHLTAKKQAPNVVFSNLKITDCYTHNLVNEDSTLSGGYGGGIEIYNSFSAPMSATINNTTFENCHANWGGGIYTEAYPSVFDLKLNNVSFANCEAYDREKQNNTRTGGSGGAVYAGSKLTIEGGKIENCRALFGGGIYYNSSNASGITLKDLQVTNCMVDTAELSNGNLYGGYGGGVCVFTNENADTTVLPIKTTNCTFHKCSARFGGSMYVEPYAGKANVTMNGDTFTESKADTNLLDEDGLPRGGTGGSIYFNGYDEGNINATLDNLTFTDSFSKRSGGAIFFYNTELMMSNSTLRSCSAGGTGGGMEILVDPDKNATSLPSATLKNVSFTNCVVNRYNESYSMGGAVEVWNYGNTLTQTATFENCRIDGCKAERGGGIASGRFAELTLKGTTIANCTAESEPSPIQNILGGGIYSYSKLELDDASKIMNCHAIAPNADTGYASAGGGIFMNYLKTVDFATSLKLNNALIDTCTAQYGSAFYVDASRIKLWEPYGNIQNCGANPYFPGYYHVSFDLNGAAGTAPAMQTVDRLVDLARPMPPARDGYEFTGWYTNQQTLGKDFYSDIIAAGDAVRGYRLTLYAGWKSGNAAVVDFAQDALGFENTREDFGITYNTLTGDYYAAIMSQLNNSEKSLVDNRLRQKWGGSCFGMASVLSLFKAGRLDTSYFAPAAKTAKQLPAPKNNASVMNLVNFYQLIQSTGKALTARANYDYSSETKNNETLVKTLQASKYPAVIGVDLYRNGRRIGGHALTAYGLQDAGANYTVSIADPNDNTAANTLTISKDFTTSTFARDYDTATISSFLKYTLKLEDSANSFDYNNIQNALQSRGNTVAPLSLEGMVSMLGTPTNTTSLFTNYYNFTINSSNGQSATFVNGEKTTGNLEVTVLGALNELNQELRLHFLLPNLTTGQTYTIIPAAGQQSILTDAPLASYETELYYDHTASGYHSYVNAAGSGTGFIFKADGSVSTKFAASTEQTVRTSVNVGTTPWNIVELQGTSTGLNITPSATTTTFTSNSAANINIAAKNENNTVKFDNQLLQTTPVRLTAEGEIAKLSNGQQKPLGYSITFYSNGGTPVAAIVDIPADELPNAPAAPTRTGYTFVAWVNVETDERFDFLSDNPSEVIVLPIIPSDMVLRAVWKKASDYDSHIVTFENSNGAEQIFTVEKNGTLPSASFPAVPMRAGYVGKWDSTGITNISEDTVVTANYRPIAGSLILSNGTGTMVGEKSDLSITISNTVSGPLTAELYWVLYDAKDALIASAKETVQVPANNNASKRISISKASGAVKGAVYLLEGGSMIPWVEGFDITLS